MALFQIDVEKRLVNEFWTNVYYADATSLDQCRDLIGLISVREKAIHGNNVDFVRGRARTKAQGDDIYAIVPIGGFGTRPAATFLPLFNTFNVVMTTEVGRPSRKYYRPPVGEGDQDNGILLAGTVTLVNNQIGALIEDFQTAGATWVDIDGQPIVSVACSSIVGMRQLRRGSKRRARPVLPAQ